MLTLREATITDLYFRVSVYTHTAESNLHVIEMNLKLGYHEVRRGPIWDEIFRVSLIKRLDQRSTAGSSDRYRR